MGGLGSDFEAGFFSGLKIGSHIGETRSFIHPSGAFEMVDEGAEVEVDGAANAVIVVAEHVFGVDEAGFVFVDFDAAFDEGEVV